MIESHGASHVGRLRQLNEDSLLVDADAGLFIVADGMGGTHAGEVASQMAVAVVTDFVRRSQREEADIWPYGLDARLSRNGNRLRNAVMLANHRVWKEADLRPDRAGMGTTIVAALADGDHLTLCSAGDSRAYLIRAGRLDQITTDDSWVQAALIEGVLSSAEARDYPLKNVLTKAVGGQESIDVDVIERQLEDGDVYLLCSDGLHAMLTDAEILETVLAAGGDLKRAGRDLIDGANSSGGKDNITALLFAYRKDRRETRRQT